GTTYYIASSFSVGPGTTTFQPGCVVKYAGNSWLLISGDISCPPAGQLMPVLTSKDDDLFGEMIPGSTHNPTYAAAVAIWVSYVNFSTLIQNMRIRWAQIAVRYESNSFLVHTIQDSKLQMCQKGLYANNCGVNIVNVTKCNVITPTFPL